MIRKILIILSVILLAGKASGQCVIDSLTISIGDCQNGLADVWLNFKHEGDGSELFRVKGNGNDYGEFTYANLPVNIGPLNIDPYQHYEFGVQDLDNDSCFNYLDYGYISCGDSVCHFRNLTVTALDSCQSGDSYAILLDFESSGMTHFDIFVNGEYYQFAAIDELPLTIDIPSKGHHSDLLKLRANDQQDCFSSIAIEVPLCNADCGISDLYTKALECDSGAFYVKLGFEHLGAHGDRFTVRGNGIEYGTFSYADIPVYLGPFEPGVQENLEFVVRDSLFPDCHLTSLVDGNPCKGACYIGKPATDIIHCDSGFFSVSLDFEYEGDLSDSFKLKGNGQIYGFFCIC
ncbi:MAG: hypothetical protein IPL46_23975 [Saprospiraceae bacterium]|nr:hypothetical protein [Saprospiraceae bacterium]